MSEIHSVGPFILGKSLGSGATGKVKLGFHKDTGFKVAIKIMNKEVLSSRPSMRKKVEREIVVMKLIDHPNVLKLHDVYETSKYLFLVLEYVEGGELFDYLINKGSLEPAEALKYFQQIIRGLDHCHSQRICHRDLKPENLLLDADKNLKIGDFGMAALMRRGALLGTSCGSPHYASPEVVTGKHYSGMTSDIWSCGVILYALLTGKLPFDDDDIRKLLGKVKSGVFSMPAFLPATAQDLIHKMLTVDPGKRITIAQIKEHKWFTSNMPDPTTFSAPLSVEDMVAQPLEDAAAIDDEILRSLKVLGLGSDMDIEHSLTSKIPNLTLVFYRLLQDRKEKQNNNTYNQRTRNRSNPNDTRERSYSEHSHGRSYDGKQRSNSFSQPHHNSNQDAYNNNGHNNNNSNNNNNGGNNNNSNGHRDRVLSLHSKQRRPSPLVDAKRGPGCHSQGLIFPLSPSNSSSSTTTFSVNDDTATIVNLSSSSQEIPPSPLSPPLSPLNSYSPLASPRNNRTSPPKEKDKYKKFSQSPPPSPPLSVSSPSSTSPISISGKSRVMKLATEGASSPLSSSPIIGSNPKRSWFSNFFTGSPHNSSSMLDDESDSGPNLTLTTPPQSPHSSHHHNHNNHNNHNHNNHNHHNNNNHHHHSNHNNSGMTSPRHYSPRDPHQSPRESHHSPREPHQSPREHHQSPREPHQSPREPHQSPREPHHSHSHGYSSQSHHSSHSHSSHHSHSNHSHSSHPPHSSHSSHPAHSHITTTGFNLPPRDPSESPATSPPTSPTVSKAPNLAMATHPVSGAPLHLTTGKIVELHTGKSGVELGAEIQRTLSALKTSWRLHTNELYTAKYDVAEGGTCQFSVSLVDKCSNANLISLSHLAGTSSFFDTLCSQFQAEVKL